MKADSRIRLPLGLWVAAVAVLMIAPTLVVIPLSFTPIRSFRFPFDGWSLQWYENFFTSARWLDALGTSLALATATGIAATILGTLAAYALDRSPRIGWVRGILMLPIVVPAIVAAVAIYGTFLGWGLSGSFLGLVVAHTALAIPFVVIPVGTAFGGLDRTLERAAAVLGANAWRRFWQIQFPILLPGVVTGFVFAFVTSLDEVVIAYFMQSPRVRTLPVQMYSSVTVETDPSIAVASTLVLVVSTLAILLPRLFMILSARRRARKAAND